METHLIPLDSSRAFYALDSRRPRIPTYDHPATPLPDTYNSLRPGKVERSEFVTSHNQVMDRVLGFPFAIIPGRQENTTSML